MVWIPSISSFIFFSLCVIFRLSPFTDLLPSQKTSAVYAHIHTYTQVTHATDRRVKENGYSVQKTKHLYVYKNPFFFFTR